MGGYWKQALDGAVGKRLDSLSAYIQSMKLPDSPLGIWADKLMPGQSFVKTQVCLG